MANFLSFLHISRLAPHRSSCSCSLYDLRLETSYCVNFELSAGDSSTKPLKRGSFFDQTFEAFPNPSHYLLKMKITLLISLSLALLAVVMFKEAEAAPMASIKDERRGRDSCVSFFNALSSNQFSCSLSIVSASLENDQRSSEWTSQCWSADPRASCQNPNQRNVERTSH